MKSQDVHKSTLIRCVKHQKPSLINSSKSQNIWDMAIVPSHIWDGTDINAKHCLAYLIHFFSLLLSNVSLCLHLSLSLSSILATPSRHTDLTTPISPRWSRHRQSLPADLATSRDRDHPGSPLITDPLYDEEELQCEGHGGRKWKLPLVMAMEAVWDVGLFDLVDGMRFVEFYNW